MLGIKVLLVVSMFICSSIGYSRTAVPKLIRCENDTHALNIYSIGTNMAVWFKTLKLPVSTIYHTIFLQVMKADKPLKIEDEQASSDEIRMYQGPGDFPYNLMILLKQKSIGRVLIVDKSSLRPIATFNECE